MYKLSRFEKIDDKYNYEQIENWAENFFFNLLNMFNAFFVHIELAEVVLRMEAIPFTELVVEQLENENEEVIKIASNKVEELATLEIDFMKSYLD
ncbi:MAG: hypothetical protein GX333_05750 [Syntrophomonadaceae bacterium]|nr:hypothetical protein [Syntrophomonadaceae bacterium]